MLEPLVITFPTNHFQFDFSPRPGLVLKAGVFWVLCARSTAKEHRKFLFLKQGAIQAL